MKSYGNSYSVGSYKQDIDELSAAKNDCARTQRLLGNSLPTLSVEQVDELYELVTEEIEQESIIKTLWTKVFSEFNGDTNRAMAEYIKQRMAALRTMAELPYDDDGVWIYYMHDDELYLDSVQCNLFYERGDGTIRTISKGHIVDIPFDQISFPQGSLDYRPTRLDGLIDIVKQKGSYMPLTNRECEDVLLNTLDALRSNRINWDDLRILRYDFETSDLILLTTDDSEVVVKI